MGMIGAYNPVQLLIILLIVIAGFLLLGFALYVIIVAANRHRP